MTTIIHNKLIRGIVAVTLIASAMPLSATVDNILPRPKLVEALSGTLRTGSELLLEDATANPVLARTLAGILATGTDGDTLKVKVIKDVVEGARDYPLASYDAEAYRLEVSPGGITITAPEAVGVTRAAQTLAQLAEGTEKELPAVTITDWPAFKLRGFLHDTGRSFISLEELMHEIDMLSRFKINTFHWHLTENQAWRFGVDAYPQLTDSAVMTRDAGSYYTPEECRRLERYAAERGVTVIPEIDMPGHSKAFTRAMGFDMQSPEGCEALKVILREACDAFPLAPYIHIGGDEIGYDDRFLVGMIDYVHSLGRKAAIWNRYNRPARLVDPSVLKADLLTNWATSGTLVKGVPNVDLRYNYINHFDVFADPVGIYKTTIFYEPEGNSDIAGTITGVWNDTRVPTETDIVCQNNFYASVLASAERAWAGGGIRYIEEGGTTLPVEGPELDEFADWERRFLHHKAGILKNEPIPYVRQTDVEWLVTEQIPNGGDPHASLPPEEYIDADTIPLRFEVGGNTYNALPARGAGIYLRHIWHPIVKGFYDNPRKGVTAYAWTDIWSPEEQDAGALVETYTYSRSGDEVAPRAGCWDRRGSRVWLNGEEIPAPEWEQPDARIPQDDPVCGLTNENLTAREPVRIHLRKGWNRVFLKLPYADNGGTLRDKWQFTFVVTDIAGRNALSGIIYSPNRHLSAHTR
ncbi:MAG: beta-N-acetylhexosaminidase [Paramuribaculum sp.]|nr:beta-N-acetylhexosaminidase [Paramuribaculum sp.]